MPVGGGDRRDPRAWERASTLAVEMGAGLQRPAVGDGDSQRPGGGGKRSLLAPAVSEADCREKKAQSRQGGR